MTRTKTTNPKNTNLGVRVTPEQRRLIEQAAAKLDRPVAWLLRSAALERAQTVLNNVEHNSQKAA
jgi:uncharacterized protein (DUF1778 family)